jgi:NAD(P)-dependent dehydrogenase (short-subunit alcohol dehydrogenase family)
MGKPLEGKVALVAGATRGAGRGIAIALGEAGATVYCTGRSVQGSPSAMNRPETIEQTAEQVTAAGGTGMAIRVDHTGEAEVEGLIARIRSEQGRLDILVNDVWGGDPMIDWSAKFWALDMATVRALVDQAILSHLITARHAARMMVEAGAGLIVEITDGDGAGYRGQLLYDLVKSTVIRLAYAMAWDLRGTGVTALAITPGFLRSEVVLESFKVSEATWREAAERDELFADSETPVYIGRTIAALAADPAVDRWSGMSLSSGALAKAYGVTDVDGRIPDLDRQFDKVAAGFADQPGELDEYARFFVTAAYMRAHRDPARTAMAQRLAERLGFTDLGAGLRPV